MAYDRFEKPDKPFVVIDTATSNANFFESLEDAEEFAIQKSKLLHKKLYVTEADLRIDGYRCKVFSAFEEGEYSTCQKGYILLHYIFYKHCKSI